VGEREYDEWIESNQGRQKLEKELQKLKEDTDKAKKIEEEKKKQDEDKKNGKEVKEENLKSEAAEKAKAKTKKWLEDELASVRETIRVRREIAVVRGAIEFNR